MCRDNAPLTPDGRLRLVRRCQTRPIASVAAEAHLSGQCLSKWGHRSGAEGEQGMNRNNSCRAKQLTYCGAPKHAPAFVVAEHNAIRLLFRLAWHAPGQLLATATAARWNG